MSGYINVHIVTCNVYKHIRRYIQYVVHIANMQGLSWLRKTKWAEGTDSKQHKGLEKSMEC